MDGRPRALIYEELVADFQRPRAGQHHWRPSPTPRASWPVEASEDPKTQEIRLAQQPPATTGIRYPRAAGVSYNARQVAKVYGCPVDHYDGSGVRVGIVELGGGYIGSDMVAAGLNPDKVTVIGVAGGSSQSD